MSAPVVIACFVIQQGDNIFFQGSFQVLETREVLTAPSTNGGLFQFRYSYSGETACIEVIYVHELVGEKSVGLSVPVNRSKVKWKKADLDGFEIYYRCAFESTREKRRSES